MFSLNNFNYYQATSAYIDFSWQYGPYICFAYILMCYFGPRLMKNHKGYELYYPLIGWNFFLAFFSIFGAYTVFPHMLNNLISMPHDEMFCNTRNEVVPELFGLWTFIFNISKLFEFVDTIFIILRKKKLIFLHYYHHLMTMFYTGYSCYFFNSDPFMLNYGYYFGSLNLLIHALMYSYYTVMATKKVRFPKIISISITSLQIFQMIIGLYIHFVIYNNCLNEINSHHIKIGFLMYLSYFVLFIHFFAKTYLGKKEEKKRE